MRILYAALCATLALAPAAANAKETVRIAFVGPLTGGNSAIGLGGRNSADLAVKLRNQDAKAKYTYDLVVLDDECKPDAGVQVATKAGSDRSIVAGVTHYCSVVAMATVDTYHRFGLPVIVWGAVLPDITYTNDYGKGHDKYFTQFLTKEGGKIVIDLGVTADQQDFTAELTQVKAQNPEVLYFGEGAPDEKLAGDKKFLEDYNKQGYTNPPEAYGPFAFAGAQLVMDAIEKVGPDRKKIIAELAKVKDVDTIVGKVTFDDHGQNTVPVITKYVVQDGKWVLWEDSEYASGKRKLRGK